MRITRPFVLLALAVLLSPPAEASRTSVWESNPPASFTATRADAAGLLASLAPTAATDIEAEEPHRFDLGDITLVESAREHEGHFDLGSLDLLSPTALRGPPPSYPETRVGGFELLPPFRVGASPTLSLWSRQACGSISCGLVSDSPEDPWGLKAECPVGYWLENGRCVNDMDEVPVIDRELEFAERALHTKDPCYPIPCMRAVTPDQQVARNLEKQAARERLVAARDELEEGLAHWAEGPQLPPIVGGVRGGGPTVRGRPGGPRSAGPRGGRVQPGRSSILDNFREGKRREGVVQRRLEDSYPEASVQRERLLRNAKGEIVRDRETGEARRVDHVVISDGKVVDSVETTGPSVDKADQLRKEGRIRQQGGRFVRDRKTREIVPYVPGLKTRVEREE